jgi:hypothetical protein
VKKEIRLQVQTPRGLWSKKEPPHATLRPEYPVETRVEQVVKDARTVFKFVENDSVYTLFRGKDQMDPSRTLESYDLKNDELLVLSVQGGNA